jgi:hypothetical protein
MAAAQVPRALVERLGSDAMQGLVSLLESRQAEWSDEVMTTVVERFDHRLAVELSAMRLEVSRELSALRVEWLKWSFLFWVGQVATMAGLLAFMLRR